MGTIVLLDTRDARDGHVTAHRRVYKLMSSTSDRTLTVLFAGWIWEVQGEIRDWLQYHCRSAVDLLTSLPNNERPAEPPEAFYLDFEDNREAVLFKLTWGGA